MAQTSSKAAGYWSTFPATYRREQVQTIANWIAVGESGAVIGGSGTGKSNLAGYISERSDVMAAHFPGQNDHCFLRLDINSLPTITTANFYRALLYTLCMDGGDQLPEWQGELAALMGKAPQGDDTMALYFTLQRAHALLIQRAGKQVVWLLDRFDEACRQLEAGTLSSLRSLRDQFKGRLTYVVFTRHPLSRLRTPTEFDEFHEIVVRNQCWVGPMVERDCRWIAQQMAERYQTGFTETDVAQLIVVTGGLPAFMKAGCAALAEGQLIANADTNSWVEQLLAQAVFRRNCEEIWHDCTKDEQQTLMAIACGLSAPIIEVDVSLSDMGLLSDTVDGQLQIFSPIFAEFVRRLRGSSEGGIAVDSRSGSVLCNGLPLMIELTQLEERLLNWFIANEGELGDKQTLISHVWPADKVADGVRDDSLAQLVKRLRDKLQVSHADHEYVQTVRGRGYRFVQPDAAEYS